MTFDEWGEFFRSHGPSLGQPMVDGPLVDETGREVALSSLWDGRPAILVSASLTCPVARGRIPQLTPLLAAYGDRLGRGVLYTKEAHPIVDKAPHADGEWVTDANRREGILHRQPRTVAERIELARTLRDGWTPGYRYFVDRMDDAIYTTLGTAPCMALLIDAQGIVRAKQGWLDPAALAASVAEHLHA